MHRPDLPMPMRRPERSVRRLKPLAMLTGIAGLMLASQAAAQSYLFRHVTVIDGRGGAPLANRDVLVEAGRIVAISRSSHVVAASAGTILIDGRGKYLIPGMIDVHVHLREMAEDGTKHGMAPAAAQAALAGYLALGFTTIAELGNLPGVPQQLRAAEQIGAVAGPHLLLTGRLFTAPGGKSAEIGLQVARPDAAVLAQHESVDRPDLIKLVHDAAGYGGQPAAPTLSRESMRAIIGDAHRRQHRALVHIAREQEAREAIAAGADALAHPVWVERESESFVRLIAARHIPFATTLAVADQYRRLIDHPEYLDRRDYRLLLSDQERQRLRGPISARFASQPFAAWRSRMLPVQTENIVRIVRAGGVAALGTDMASGPSAHREMQLLAEAGLRPLEILRIATLNAAAFLGLEHDRGSIEPGKRADLILLSRDPTADVENFEAIDRVMRDGVPIDRAKLIAALTGP